MSQKNHYRKNRRDQSKKIAISVIIGLSVLLITAVVAQQFVGQNEVHALEAHDGSLALPMDMINEEIAYFSYEHEGTYMELFAVKDSHGHMVTAMNTCFNCYNTGNGYFTQQGHELVCNNCGNHYNIEDHNHNHGTNECAPITITEDMLEQDGENLYLKIDALSAFVPLFENWQ